MATDSKEPARSRPRPKIGSLAGVNRDIQGGFAIHRALRAALEGRRTVVRIHGGELAVIPLRDLRRLEWFLEQEREEDEIFDPIDIAEVERILADPNEVPIPYEQVRRELGLHDLSD